MFEDERKNSLIREEENNLPQMKPLFFLYVLLNLVKYKEKRTSREYTFILFLILTTGLCTLGNRGIR